MKASKIYTAIHALKNASRALYIGGASIEEQMVIGRACIDAYTALEIEMDDILPPVEIEREAA